MPIDSWTSRLENEIDEIREYITVLTQDIQLDESNEIARRAVNRLIARLEREKVSTQRQLEAHRQRNRELGIQY